MANRPPPTARPLDSATLDRLALHYVARYATTRAKLARYLARKIADRGWAGDVAADPEAIADRMTDRGYIDDGAFARGKADALLRRGYGERRIGAALRDAGVAHVDRERDAAREWDAALAYARRRRIGPYAAVQADRDAERRAVAAMLRAGHDFTTARRIVAAPPGEVPEPPC
jgi:regulatory protein